MPFSTYIIGFTIGYLSFTIIFAEPTIDISIVGTTRGLPSTLACKITGYDISGTTAWHKASSSSDTGDQVLLCVGETCLLSGNGERYTFNRNGTGMYLTIKQLTRTTDQGWWRCVVQSVTPNVQKYEYLNVYSSPGGVSYNSPPTGPTDLGVNSFSIQCQTDKCSYPQPTFEWYYMENGVRVEYSGGQQQGTESSTGCTDSEKIFTSKLTIPQLTVFQGDVDKTVSFICGMNHQSIGWLYTAASQTVRFAFKPAVEVRIGGNRYETYPVQEDSSVGLTCTTLTSNPSPSSYTWNKGSDTLPGSTSAIHTISPVKRGDDGSYTCVANNGVGSGTSQSVLLDVQFTPEITGLVVTGATEVPGMPATYEATEGASITMTCNFDSNPTATVQWTKSGSATSDRIQAECANTAVPFTCTATNPIGSNSTTFQLYVKCHPRTDPSKTVENEVYGLVGESVQMVIHVIAYPPPTFKWHKLNSDGTGEELPTAQHTDDATSSTVDISNLQEEDFGNYTVTVSNEVNTEPPFKHQFQVINGAPPVPDPDPKTGSNSGAAVGGAIGGTIAVLVAVVVVVIVIVRRRRGKGSPKSDMERNGRESRDRESEITENKLYEPAGPKGSGSAPVNGDQYVYAQVDKSKKKQSPPPPLDNVYAEVNKPKNGAAQEKTNGKADKKKKGDKKGKGKQGADAKNKDQSTTGKKPNKDGLMYAELEFQTGPGEPKMVIHGQPTETEYADIAIQK